MFNARVLQTAFKKEDPIYKYIKVYNEDEKKGILTFIKEHDENGDGVLQLNETLNLFELFLMAY